MIEFIKKMDGRTFQPTLIAVKAGLVLGEFRYEDGDKLVQLCRANHKEIDRPAASVAMDFLWKGIR